MKLILVNDERLIAESMYENMPWSSYGIDHVSLAFSAEDAKKILKKEKIDIALLDIEMPGESGIDLLRWIRNHNLDIECIFLTCHANFVYAKEAVKLDCQDYILMPYRDEEVEESIRRVVERINVRRDGERLQAYGRQWVSQTQEEINDQKENERRSRAIRVNDAIAYIMENLCSETLSPNEVAAHLFVTPVYLSRIFSQEKGQTISQFIISEKMMLAKKLLEESGLNANAVALKVGYPSYPYFSTTFKKYFGYSPSKLPQNPPDQN